MFLGEHCGLNHWPGYKLMWEYIPNSFYPSGFSYNPGDFNQAIVIPNHALPLHHLKSKAGISVTKLRLLKKYHWLRKVHFFSIKINLFVSRKSLLNAIKASYQKC